MIRLDDGESSELVQAITSQTLTFIGATNAADSSPNYSSVLSILDGDSLVTAIGKLDAAAALKTVDETISGHWTFGVTDSSDSPDFIVTDALNNTIARVVEFTHLTSGSPAAGIGTELALSAENAAGSTVLTASLQGAFSTVTAGSEVSYLDFFITKAGASINPLSLSTTNAYSGGLVFSGPSLLLKGNASQPTPALIIQAHSSGGNAAISLDSSVSTSGQRVVGIGYGTRGNDLFTIGLHNETSGALVRNILCYDGTTNYFGIGTEGPDEKLEVVNPGTQLRLTYTEGAVLCDFDVDSSGYLNITPTGGVIQSITSGGGDFHFGLKNTNPATANAVARYEAHNGTYYAHMAQTCTGYTGYGAAIANTAGLYGNNPVGLFVMADNATAKIMFTAGGNTELMQLSAAGRLGVGTTGPDAQIDSCKTTEQLRLTYTDGAVYASHLVNSSGYHSITATGDRYGFGTTSPSTMLHADRTGDALDVILRLSGDSNKSLGVQTGATNGYFVGYKNNTNFGISYDVPLGTNSYDIMEVTAGTGEIGFNIDPVSGVEVTIGNVGDNGASILRIKGGTGTNGTLQLTDGAHGYALIYDYVNNDCVINYDSTVGSGSQECARWNESGEMLQPAVDPPTANYTNRHSYLQGKIACDVGGTSIDASFNVSSISDLGTGITQVFWNTDFASGNYVAVTSIDTSSTTIDEIQYLTAKTSTYVIVKQWDISSAALVDGSCNILASGTQ